MKHAAACLLSIVLVGFAIAEEPKAKPAVLNPGSLDVDSIGVIEGKLTISKIINDEDMIVATDKQPAKKFILRKPTKNQAEGKEFQDAGLWLVKKVISFEGRKYYLLVPAETPKR